MKKFLILLFLFVSVLTVGCSNKALPEPFTHDGVSDAATQVITVFSNDDRQAFFDMCSNNLKTVLTNNDLDAAITQVMPAPGTLKQVDTKAVTATKDNDGNDIVVAVINAEYDSQRVTYTISFDKNMKICGFYIK